MGHQNEQDPLVQLHLQFAQNVSAKTSLEKIWKTNPCNVKNLKEFSKQYQKILRTKEACVKTQKSKGHDTSHAQLRKLSTDMYRKQAKTYNIQNPAIGRRRKLIRPRPTTSLHRGLMGTICLVRSFHFPKLAWTQKRPKIFVAKIFRILAPSQCGGRITFQIYI